ncbi:MAG TPA: EutN/CcmL family microcompartment protein [Verrucomicrobiae bacterium]|nr:EutN/CcmL family microcompartment protein [Verrucomicrobiae bacterium]
MRMGTVIGRVTLSVRHPSFQGERLLLTSPWKKDTYEGKPAFDPAIVVYDVLGAGVGQQIGISEGREAACPFERPTPVDAYCAALIDEFYCPPEGKAGSKDLKG